MVFCHPEQHEQLGAVPIRLTKFPERAAHGVDACRGHVYGTEPAMGRIVGCAKILCPEAGERLRLIPPGEKRQLFRVRPQRFQPPCGDVQRFVPADFFELARPARPDPLQRCTQTRRRVVLHDPRAALGAQHPTVHRMVAVAFDIGDLAIFHMDIDPAAAGAHVACRLANLVRDRRRRVQFRLSHATPFLLASLEQKDGLAASG